MEKRNLTCIGCPMGCQITVEFEGEEVFSVKGNTCAIGDKYARQEVTHPERTVTSTVVVVGGAKERTSVKTNANIPKDKIFQCMEEINKGLPGLDCGSCGAPTCRAMAEDIVRGKAKETDCIHKLKAKIQSVYDQLKNTI